MSGQEAILSNFYSLICSRIQIYDVSRNTDNYQHNENITNEHNSTVEDQLTRISANS